MHRNNSKQTTIFFLRKALIIIALFFSGISYAQNVTTIAGTGSFGNAGDGGPATSATLKNAEMVALDAAGNIYIAGDGGHSVRRIDISTGIIKTVAGNGTSGNSGDGGLATSAQLSFPMGLAFDRDGNLYIADFYNANIRKVDIVTGIISTIAGIGTAGYNGDNILATSAQLYYPFGIAVNNDGDVYVADLKNSRIRKITASSGIITTVVGTGTAGYGGDGGQGTSGMLNYPQVLVLDSNGDLIIADQENNRVRKYEVNTGIITTIAGNGTGGFSGDGGTATTAALNYPTGLAFDAAGNLYIGDQNNKRVRKVTQATRKISTVAGNGTAGYSGDNGPATSAKFSYLDGVAVDAAGNIYISDTGNNRIRKITYSTVVSVPLTLVSFTASTDEDKVKIKWQAALEENIAGYKLEKSYDGIDFTEIYSVTVYGNSVGLKNYDFTDNTAASGTAFYRLKIITHNGNHAYSGIIINKSTVANIEFQLISPNPLAIGSDLKIKLEAEAGSVRVINSMGQMIYSQTISSTDNVLTIPSFNLIAGIYTVQVLQNENAQQLKFVVQ